MNARIPFRDLSVTDDHERRDILEAIDKVLAHGRIINGPEVHDLESRIAASCGRKYAVGVGSGSDALFLAMKCLDIGPRDEVVTTPLSWIATANAVALTGATPKFSDIGNDLNMDPLSVRQLITKRTKAILPVHFTGKVCDMASLKGIADEHSLLLIEDAAQAFNASWKGRKAGSFGVVSCLSLNPMKVFAACGEAGMILTDREDLRDRLIQLRHNGTVNRQQCIEPGINSRLDTLQAAILLVRLKNLESVINKRRQIANWYHEQLAEVVEVPTEADGEKDVYYTYTIQADDRDALMRFLEEKNIETQIQHPYLMPEQPAYRSWTAGSFPNAGRLVKRILCIPAHEKLRKEEVDYVAASIREFYKS